MNKEELEQEIAHLSRMILLYIRHSKLCSNMPHSVGYIYGLELVFDKFKKLDTLLEKHRLEEFIKEPEVKELVFKL